MTQQASVISKNQIDTFLNSDPKLKAELNNMKSNLKELIIKASIHESNGNFKAAMIYSTVALYIASSVSPTLATQQMTLIQNMAQQARTKFEIQVKSSALGSDEDTTLFKAVPADSIKEPSTGLPLDYNNLIGMLNEKQEMIYKFILPQLNPELFFTATNNTLLFGPPGTGKTMIAKASVVEFNKKDPNNFKAIFFSETASSLKSKWEGGTEKQIQQLFEEADKQAKDEQKRLRAIPVTANINVLSVIFLDEIEEITLSRSISDKSGSTVTTLLQQMGGLKTYNNIAVIAATNYPWNIDDAVMRRFPTKIFVDLSDGFTRFHMLCSSILTKFLKLDPARLCSFEFKDMEVKATNRNEFQTNWSRFYTAHRDYLQEMDSKKISIYDAINSKKDSIKVKAETDDEKKQRIELFKTNYLQNGDNISDFIDNYLKNTLIPYLKNTLTSLNSKDTIKYNVTKYISKIGDLAKNSHIKRFLLFMFFVSLYIGPNMLSYRTGFVVNRHTHNYTQTRFGYSSSDTISLIKEFFTKMAMEILSNQYTSSGKAEPCSGKMKYDMNNNQNSPQDGYTTIRNSNFVQATATVNSKNMMDALESFRPSSDTPNYCSHVCYQANKDNPESCAELCEKYRNELKDYNINN